MTELRQDPEPARIGEALIKAAPDWLDEVETIHHAFRYACASIALKNKRIAALEDALRVIAEECEPSEWGDVLRVANKARGAGGA